MDKQKVWIADPIDGFILGHIVDMKADEVILQPDDTKKAATTCEFDRTYPAEEYNKDVDDNCVLMHLNEATLLNNVRLRFMKDKIYTYVANILIALNPYFEIKHLYTRETMRSYQGKSLGVSPPHVFAIADKAFRDMKVVKQSQSIIVSGESGAGKTESTKYLLRYLCDLWGSTTSGPIEQKILDANPVLEAFGNAKTTRNNNSSRFGKFMEIHFDGKYGVVGGYISHYLLEKSRISSPQSGEERNYHIFYHLMAGAPQELRTILRLSHPDDFNYLKKGCTQYFTNSKTEKILNAAQMSSNHKRVGNLKDPVLDDVNDFQNVDRALTNLGLTREEKLDIYRVTAAVLHLGNIEFEENHNTKGGCNVVDRTHPSLVVASTLLAVDADELRQSLLTKVMMTNRGGPKGTVIMVPLKVYEANHARDALAKSIYSRLFDQIVKRINASIPFKESVHYIGVLDIAGFEYFTLNSFEQFCINYCNEKLQQFFNKRILKDEQALYEKEGLLVKKIQFVDNQDCIDLIEGKNLGIFSILDEESKLPKHSAEHFTREVHNKWSGHFRLAFPRSSKLKAHRELRDDEGFVVRHFAGGVCYSTGQFIEKNNDALHDNLEELVRVSRDKFVANLFATGKSKVSNEPSKGKLNFISVSLKFRSQLGQLMEKLKSTGTNFVRCIKPNHTMEHHVFEGGSVLSQLQCSGMTSVMELMQQGYPSRCPFNSLYDTYKRMMPPDLARLHSHLFCKALFRAVGMSEKDYKFGVSKVFFKPGKFAEFDTIMKSDVESLARMIAKVKKWLVASRFKKAQWCALVVVKLKNKILYRRDCIITIQKYARSYLSMKKHKHRYMGMKKINGLKTILCQMEPLINELNKSQKEEFQRRGECLKSEIHGAINLIKSNESMLEGEIEKMYLKLMEESDRHLVDLKAKVAEGKRIVEQGNLKRIQEGMDRQRKHDQASEESKKSKEMVKKQKMEMEARRKEAEMNEQKLAFSNMPFQSPEKLKQIEEEQRKIELHLREKLEQERRDLELALRLAQETDTVLEVDRVKENTKGLENGKTDLTKWKYSKLRDTINTSCDIKLLEACRAEFHRRLKVYHAWKAKNNNRSILDDNERVPRAILEEANRRKDLKKCLDNFSGGQRYFRIPFVKPHLNASGSSAVDAVSRRGLWYAHFDGKYVARQMELHPDKMAILLVAGKDDMQMCELSLDETGLTRKRGAEITGAEFEREWKKHGGQEYARPGGGPNSNTRPNEIRCANQPTAV